MNLILIPCFDTVYSRIFLFTYDEEYEEFVLMRICIHMEVSLSWKVSHLLSRLLHGIIGLMPAINLHIL
jgi:hypothetical protein